MYTHYNANSAARTLKFVSYDTHRLFFLVFAMNCSQYHEVQTSQFFVWLRATKNDIFPQCSLIIQTLQHTLELWLTHKRTTQKLLRYAQMDRVVLHIMDVYSQSTEVQYLGLQILSIIMSGNRLLQSQSCLSHFRTLQKIMVHIKYNPSNVHVVSGSTTCLWHSYNCRLTKVPEECSDILVKLICQQHLWKRHAVLRHYMLNIVTYIIPFSTLTHAGSILKCLRCHSIRSPRVWGEQSRLLKSS